MPGMREIQLFELKMLKDIAKVCEDNGIQYYLSYGTLLGAVRHGGFIPWDDDIDLIMPLADYKKFLKIGQKLLNEVYGNIYFVQNYQTDTHYREMWTQIRANNTTSMPIELKGFNIHWGMCLDIFPIIGSSDNPEKQEKALQFNRKLLSDSYIHAVNEPMSQKQKLLYMIPRCIRKLICKLNERNFMLDPTKCEKSTIVWCNIPSSLPSDVLSKKIKIKFEDDEFYTMKEYDQYLTHVYGDYMTPPDEKDRGGHELTLGDIIIDLENDYTKYK